MKRVGVARSTVRKRHEIEPIPGIITPEGELSLRQSASWQELLRDSNISLQELLVKTGNPNHPLADDTQHVQFPLRVPKPYLEKIRFGDPQDPLLLQVLPQLSEHITATGFESEPLQEQDYSPVPGLIHKYQSRVLLVSTQACAIHCRYCFRRHFPYSDHQRSREEWMKILEYVQTKPEVNEIILSGGDPLSLPDNYLSDWLTKLANIEQVKRIRIHTRMLPSLPQRVTDRLCKIFAHLPCKVVFVAHCNHPNELADDTASAFRKLKASGVLVLNQSVLLAGVNDDTKTLSDLSEKLFDQSVLPYYLFLLDKVSGASHFDLEDAKARALYKQLAASLPGYLVPKLAREIPGEQSKSLIGFA